MRVHELLDKLNANIETKKLSSKELCDTLQQLKVEGRNADAAVVIASEKGINLLSQYAFDYGEQGSIESSREALRCLGNTLLLVPGGRREFVKLNKLADAVKLLDKDDLQDNFLALRLLYFVSHEATSDFNVLVQEHGLVEKIQKSIARFQKSYDFTNNGASPSTSIPIMALAECLRLIFSLSHAKKIRRPFEPVIPSIVNLLTNFSLSTNPLKFEPELPPISHLLNVLLSLTDTNDLSQATRDTFTTGVADRLLEILNRSLPKSVKTANLEGLDNPLTVLFGVITQIYSAASTEVRERFQSCLLPTEAERNLPLGKSDSLTSRTLNLTAVPACRNASRAGMHMFYILSNQNARKYVENVGYGFASGYMAEKGIPFSLDEGEAHTKRGPLVNPITGQLLDAEESQGVKLPPMTKEEKEREAEKMFVLFERMRATGVIEIKNPVQEAVDSGRFQEIEVSDSDNDSSDEEAAKGKETKQ